MDKVVSQVIVLFIIIIIGFVCRKKGILGGEINKGIADLLLYVTLPLLIISSFNFTFSRNMLYTAVVILVISFIIHFMSYIIGLVLFRKYPVGRKKVLQFMTIFSNCGYMGFPVLTSIFKEVGVFYGSMYNIPFTIFVWTIGVRIFQGKEEKSNLKKVLINPGIIATIIGLIIFIFSIKMPAPLADAIKMVGSMTTPLSMLIIGSMLADADLKASIFDKTIYYATFVRIVLLPGLALGVLRLLGMRGIPLTVSVLMIGMPVAANTVIFSEKYGGDSVFASTLIFLTTLLSLATIPVIILLSK
ncbi:MAG TPA: AEC family transporter [Clostridiaceae bacterium]